MIALLIYIAAAVTIGLFIYMIAVEEGGPLHLDEYGIVVTMAAFWPVVGLFLVALAALELFELVWPTLQAALGITAVPFVVAWASSRNAVVAGWEALSSWSRKAWAAATGWI